MAITREKFIEATGREPEQDDLERVNCDKAGQIGHFCCGWDHGADKPRFETWPADMARRARAEKAMPALTPYEIEALHTWVKRDKAKST